MWGTDSCLSSRKRRRRISDNHVGENLVKKAQAVLVPAFLCAILCAAGCYPDTEATMVRKEQVSDRTRVNSPTKVFLQDESVILFPSGFRLQGDTLSGTGQRYRLEDYMIVGYRYQAMKERQSVPLDSVIAMTYYEQNLSGGKVLASLFLGIFGATLTPLSIYCLLCPKCCFGSCPTVYTMSDSGSVLEAELFSHSISKCLEEDDLALIDREVPGDGNVTLRLTNEALETHSINEFQLRAVSHPAGTRVYPGVKKDIITVRSLTPAAAASDRSGKDVTAILDRADGEYYRSGETTFTTLTREGQSDWLELRMGVAQGVKKVTLVLRLRNTLLSTVLFYDVVLGSQGIGAVDWIGRLNTDRTYAAAFRRVYETFSGIKVEYRQNGEWKEQASITDVGPISWKYRAVEIPVGDEGDLVVRLRFFPDNFMIDYAGFDLEPTDVSLVSVVDLFPDSITDNAGNRRPDLLQTLRAVDDSYLVTEPGEAYRFSYHVPRTGGGPVTLLVHSDGYYTEWLRGSWIKGGDPGYHFDLFDIEGTLKELSRKWVEDRPLMEKKFFESRIPVKEAR